MSDDLISEQALRQKIDKIKVSSAEIVVNGTKEKPYFEIKYFDLSDNEMHIGFSSYKLDVVFGYLEKYFDIAEGNSESEQNNNHILGDLISRKDLLGTERLLMTDIVENNEVAKYILEQVLYDIEHAETAFDKEKVIEELKSWEKASHNAGIQSTYAELDNKASGYYQESRAYHRAIKIVEKGGIE